MPGAAALFAQAVAERPAVAGYRRRLADVYGALGRGRDAVAQYDALLAIVSDDAGVLVDRGVTLARLGRSAEAEADYRRALALDPDMPEAHLNLALLALAGGSRGGSRGASAARCRAPAGLSERRTSTWRASTRGAATRRGREHADRAAGVGGARSERSAPGICSANGSGLTSCHASVYGRSIATGTLS